MSSQLEVDVKAAKEARAALAEAERAVSPAELVEWARTKLLEQIADSAPEAAEPILNVIGELAELVPILEELLDKATTWHQRMVIMAGGLDSVVDLVETAGALGGLDGSTKQAAVIAASLAIYERVDKGHDGKKNRVKIPWIPATMSDALERLAVKYAVTFGIELIIGRLNRNK